MMVVAAMSACSSPAPALEVSPVSLNLGLSDTGTLTVANVGEAGSVLNWSLDISYEDILYEEGTGWLSVEPASGSTPSGAVTTLD
ncbi:MAG: hypothetical protein M3511_11050, partial [Deinococcota bacterium]|nr:hypothetical protein [Deinococcota bacterium]